MISTALSVNNLVVRRGNVLAINHLSCDLPAASITGLIGPSGSGKSTLMRSIVGVQKIESGNITVLGQPAGSKSLRNEVGYMTQSPSVYKDLSVQANVAYFATFYGKSANDVNETIDAVGLHDYAHTLTGNLSGGQFSRVSLACALISTPKLLILDEPTVGLDPVLRDDLWHFFDSLVKDGMTLIVSSHVMDEAARCDSIMLLRDGALMANVSPDELRRQGKSEDLDTAFLNLIREQEAKA